jgi:hypothetical protein
MKKNEKLNRMLALICVFAALVVLLIWFIGVNVGMFETSEGELEVSFQPPTTTVDPDSQFVLQVLITPVDNPVKGCGFDIDFDPEYLQVLMVEPSDDLFGTGMYLWFSPDIDNNAGYIDDVIMLGLMLPEAEPGVLCEITFEAQENLGTTALDFLNLDFTDDTQNIPAIGFSGEVTIGSDDPPAESPGFEIFTLIVAIGIALVILKKRKG